MARERTEARLRGVTPLVMHAPVLADPMHPLSRELRKYTSTRSKTAEIHTIIRHLQLMSGLWLDSRERPCIPARAVMAVMIEAARARKRGKAMERGVVVTGDAVLEYDGPKTPAEIAADPGMGLVVPVNVGKNKVIRSRPIFRTWAATVAIDHDIDIVSRDDILETLRYAGEYIGIGDGRSRLGYGRFSVET